MKTLSIKLSEPNEPATVPEMWFHGLVTIRITEGRICGIRSFGEGSELICRIEQRWKGEIYELAVFGKVHEYRKIEIIADR